MLLSIDSLTTHEDRLISRVHSQRKDGSVTLTAERGDDVVGSQCLQAEWSAAVSSAEGALSEVDMVGRHHRVMNVAVSQAMAEVQHKKKMRTE